MANEIRTERLTKNEGSTRNLRNVNQELQAHVREVKSRLSVRLYDF